MGICFYISKFCKQSKATYTEKKKGEVVGIFYHVSVKYSRKEICFKLVLNDNVLGRTEFGFQTLEECSISWRFYKTLWRRQWLTKNCRMVCVWNPLLFVAWITVCQVEIVCAIECVLCAGGTFKIWGLD